MNYDLTNISAKMKQRLLNKLRGCAISEIKTYLFVNDLKELRIADIEEGYSPVIQRDEVDEDNTYTLDRIYIEDRTLFFDASSCFANQTWSQESLSLDVLIDIVTFLEDHTVNIKEYAEEQK